MIRLTAVIIEDNHSYQVQRTLYSPLSLTVKMLLDIAVVDFDVRNTLQIVCTVVVKYLRKNVIHGAI